MVELFRDAPSLTSLRLVNPPSWEAEVDAQDEFSWTNIREASLTSIPKITSFTALMNRVHNVTVLPCSHCVGSHIRQELSKIPYLLPHLAVLFWENFSDILSVITAPRLEALFLLEDPKPEDMIAFITRSKCDIQHLYIEYFRQEAFVDVLDHMPNMCVLAVSASIFDTLSKTLSHLCGNHLGAREGSTQAGNSNISHRRFPNLQAL